MLLWVSVTFLPSSSVLAPSLLSASLWSLFSALGCREWKMETKQIFSHPQTCSHTLRNWSLLIECKCHWLSLRLVCLYWFVCVWDRVGHSLYSQTTITTLTFHVDSSTQHYGTSATCKMYYCICITITTTRISALQCIQTLHTAQILC